MTDVTPFLPACAAGDLEALQWHLTADPTLVSVRDEAGRTGLHLGVGHVEVVRVLLAHGADPNARDQRDNVTPLHLAAALGQLESATLLLDAGADVHGIGDAHEGEVIGWAAGGGQQATIDLLLSRGARHHVFSAMALRDRDLVRRIVGANPAALHRRRSRFENRHTALHAAVAPPDGVGYLAGAPDHAMLALLIELGADVDATDDRGRTPLDLALLRGDRESARLLQAAGAEDHAGAGRADVASALAALAGSVEAGEPMFSVRDAQATVAWYRALGFAVQDAYEEDGQLRFARLSFGRCRFALSPTGQSPANVSLWIHTTAIESIYALVKDRQLHAVRGDGARLWSFSEDLYQPFYGGRQFSLRDPDGLAVVFYQPSTTQ